MKVKRNKKVYTVIIILILFLSRLSAQSILSITNRPDPFGPLPATTTNIIHLSGNDDLVDIFYDTKTPPSIVRRLYNAVTGSVDQRHIWNGQDDNNVNLPAGTYKAEIKLNRVVTYYTKLPPNKNFIDFDQPRDIACDRWGNVYVIDSGLSIVEKFSSTGVLLLKFGSAGTGNGQFSNPLGITVDTNGYIYVSDDLGGTGRIQRFKPDGTYTNSYTSATYNNPQGMGYDPNIHRIYFVDTASDDIIRLNPDTMAYDYANTSMGNWNPTDIAIDPADGDIYVVVLGGWVLRWTRAQFEANGGYNNAWNVGASGFWGITVRSNWFYIVAQNNNLVNQRNKNTGASVENYGTQGSGTNQFNAPYSIAYDSKNDFLWVTDSGNKRIKKMTDTGSMTTVDIINADPAGLINPMDIAIDSEGNLYVCDNGHYSLKKFDKFGNFIMSIGGYGTGPGQFRDSRGVAVDRDNYIYVSDYANNNIQKFAPNGSFVTQWSVVQPVGMCSGINGTNIYYIRNRDNNPGSQDNRMIRMNRDGVILQDFMLSFNDVSYYDLGINSQGYAYCICAGTGNYIDRYPPTANGNTTPTWVWAGNPNGVAIDDFDTLWVPRGANNVRVYNFPMQQLHQFGSAGSGNGQFNNPNNAAIKVLGLPNEWADLWIIDTGNDRVQKFIVNWSDEKDEYVTIANSGSPFVTTAFPDETLSTNVNFIDGIYYARSGKTTFKIYFSQQMNTNVHPTVRYMFNSVYYDISEISYINNVWIGTAWISTNMGEGNAIFYITGAENTLGSNLDPDPNTSYSFILDTVPPNPPFIEQPPSPTTFTDIKVNGSTEAEIYVNVYNYDSSSNGSIISYQSNILSDTSGNFTATSIKLQTPKPSTNYITGIAIDKAGNISREYFPRRKVRCINSGGGTAYITPDNDKYLGETGLPNLKIIWTADAHIQNGTVVIDIPGGWAAPSLSAGNAGYAYISDSDNITFVGSPTNLQVSSNHIKICFSEAVAGGFFELTYGTNNLTLVSNNASIGINNFNMHSTNNDPGYRTNWNLPQLVYPAVGKKLYINVLPLPLKVTHYNLLPHQVYIGQHFVNAMKFIFTNQNQFYDNAICYMKLRTLDTNFNSITPSTVISKVYIYTNNVEFYVDNSIETSGDTIMLDFSSEPLTINKLSSKEVIVKIDISATATADNLKLEIVNSNSFNVKEKESQTEMEIRATNDSFPMYSTNCIIVTNEKVERFFSSYSNKMPYYVDTSQQGVVPVHYVFHNTNSNGNDIHITSLKLKIENSVNVGIIPSRVISKVIVEDISGSPVYLTKTSIETTGDTIFLDLYPANLYISANTSKTANIKLDISNTPLETNFKISLEYSTNIHAEDNVFKTSVTNFPYTGFSYPMRTSSADIANEFIIYHQTNAFINQYSSVVIKVVNINGGVINNYNGIISLDTDGTPTTIDWSNYSGLGVLNNIPSDDKCVYNFVTADNGIVSLLIIDSSVESVNISVKDDWINDSDTEGYLFFNGLPDIEISKTVYPLTAKPYETLTYTIKYSNKSIYSADNFSVVESLPEEVLYITNSAEISNKPHSGTVTVFYATNYTNIIWLNSNYDTDTNVIKIKKIKWEINTSIGSNAVGFLKFKVLIK